MMGRFDRDVNLGCDEHTRRARPREKLDGEATVAFAVDVHPRAERNIDVPGRSAGYNVDS